MITNNHKDFIENIKSQKSNYKLMGIDFGTKKIGLAFVSSITNIPTPFKTIDRKTNAYDFELLSKIIIDNNVDGIVIGLPLDTHGEEGETAKKVRSFAKKINKATGKPITFEDERFSSFIANDMLIQVGMNRKKRAQIDDQVSASVILDSFMRNLK